MLTFFAEVCGPKIARPLLLGVLGLALLVRLVVSLQLANSPCAHLHHWDQSDMHLFDRWASALADGDWLTDQSIHPVFRWNRAVARTGLEANPDDPANGADDPAKALWHRWFGHKRFHQEPLYAYLVGVSYSLFGRDARPLFALQALIGLLTVGLVFSLTRRFYGPWAGCAAGALTALCAPLVFYEQVMLRASLIVFAGLGLVWLVTRAQRRDRLKDWIGAGLGLGLALLLKMTFAVFGLGVLIGLALIHRKDLRGLAKRSAAMAAGVLLLLLPLLARNLAVDAPAMSSSSVGAMTFIASNAGDARPQHGFEFSRHMAPIMGETDGKLLPSVVRTLQTHASFGSFVGQQFAKVWAVWHWYELPNNTNLYFYQLHAPLLACLPIGFLFVGPFGLIGLGLAWRQRRALWPLYLLVGASLLAPLVFVPLSRHRLGLLVALLPFAGLCLHSITCWLQQLRFKQALATLLGAIVLMAPMWRAIPEGRGRIRPSDHIAAHEAYYAPLEAAALKAGNPEEASRLLAEFLELEPPGLLMGKPPSQRTCQLAEVFGQVHARQADHKLQLGMPDKSRKHRARADALFVVSGHCFP